MGLMVDLSVNRVYYIRYRQKFEELQQAGTHLIPTGADWQNCLPIKENSPNMGCRGSLIALQ
jgi:hypothetical protein